MNYRHQLIPVLIAGIAASATLTSQAQNASAAQQSIAAYRQGAIAEKMGDAAAAKKAYETALQLNPKNADARYRLGQVKINYDKIAATGRESAFSRVVIAEFKVADATFKDSLEALSQLTEKASNASVTPNFIIQDPKAELGERKVTLVMKNVPAGGILRYLLEMTQSKARYDEHAIVITSQ